MSAVTLSHSPRPPSRIVAGLLSLLVPGVGHLYAGHGRRGIALFTAFIVLHPILIAGAYLLAPTFRALSLFVVAVIVVLFLAYLFIVVDAVRLARRGSGTRWYVWLAAIGAAWLFWYAVSLLNPAIKSMVPWQTFSVASTSMRRWASTASRSTLLSARPTDQAKPELVLASALKPSPCK